MRIYIPVKYEELFKNFLDFSQVNLDEEELSEEEQDFIQFVREKLLNGDYSNKPNVAKNNEETSKEISILFDNKKEQ
jgi:hypothetical protein